ncbi:MAG: HEAT repeat domain-containing protein [Nitrospira sp.]|nr:HEAT repeat domain-containing protein [Nitrospira sp.]MDH4369913.1 HEAT repeat domain-containing protein [Nitrospira sp.]MDH5348474.1 HEAT repeat domain-containing protein [Nitrospira sp.]MDH5497347.1 HEAT repeat domain-containing protein [Nitrospira sp.]MDH5725113.1 HEAT repeat domain-containing protein [Nitrospira sp.]
MSALTIRQAAIVLFALVWLLPILEPACGGTASDLQKIQTLYDKTEYQKALEELAKLDAEASSAPDVRRLKVRTLLRLGNPKDALTEYDKLTQMLKQDDRLILREVALGFVVVLTKDMREQMRGAAYTALKEWQSPDAIPFFEDGLSDGSGLVRALAAEGLAKLDAGRRSTKFRQALGDQAVLVKEAVLKGFAKADDASVVSLVEPLLKDPEVRVRVAAAEVLCHLKRSKACDLLLRYAKAPNPDERTSAIRALVTQPSSSVYSILMEASQHKQPSVRGAAATGFGHMSSTQAVLVLTRLLRDPLTPVRIAAAVSLGKMQGSDARSPLINALDDRDSAVRAFVIGALLELDERYEIVASSVRTLINTKEPAVRAAVARALGHAGQANREPARSALMLLVQDTVPRVRIAAIRSIAKIEGASAREILQISLHDEDDAVRATAGGALLTVVAPNE